MDNQLYEAERRLKEWFGFDRLTTEDYVDNLRVTMTFEEGKEKREEIFNTVVRYLYKVIYADYFVYYIIVDKKGEDDYIYSYLVVPFEEDEWDKENELFENDNKVTAYVFNGDSKKVEQVEVKRELLSIYRMYDGNKKPLK